MLKSLIIFGSAEIGEFAKFYFKNDSDYRVPALTVEEGFVKGDSFQVLPLVPFGEVGKRFSPSDYGMHVALSYSRLNCLRQEKYEQAGAAGYGLAFYVSSKSVN